MNPSGSGELLGFGQTTHTETLPSIDDDGFSISDLLCFGDDDEAEISLASSSAEPPHPPPNDADPSLSPNFPMLHIDPSPHISSQFYTFNKASHALMTKCLTEGRYPSPQEIQAVNPPTVLASWRSVWRDRNEYTAYATAWKRIQNKLTMREEDPTLTLIVGKDNRFICFKNNLNQFVSYVDQWQDIVMACHSDGDLRHLDLGETIDRIKQVWSVGSKCYGIPDSFIRACVAACPVCSDDSSPGSARRSKKRKFEFTESFDVPAKDAHAKLLQLAMDHKTTLCIRQQYVRYKPFMAAVKDYTCHRAGDPTPLTTPRASKRPRTSKSESYVSKRCGCTFRIRAILPITNYNGKDKRFVYKDEGTAIFKMYPVHSGHEPGPSDGNARVMHRLLGREEEALVNKETQNGQ